MSIDILLLIIAGLLIAGQLIIRTNSAVVFFGLCAGNLLMVQFATEAQLISGVYIQDSSVNNAAVSIFLLLLPAVLSGYFLRKSISAGQAVITIFPAAAAALLTILLVAPLLPPGVFSAINGSYSWDLLGQLRPLIIIGGVISSLFAIFLTAHGKHKKSRLLKKRH